MASVTVSCCGRAAVEVTLRTATGSQASNPWGWSAKAHTEAAGGVRQCTRMQAFGQANVFDLNVGSKGVWSLAGPSAVACVDQPATVDVEDQRPSPVNDLAQPKRGPCQQVGSPGRPPPQSSTAHSSPVLRGSL